MVLLIVHTPSSFSETLELFSSSEVYAEGQPLFVYGKGLPNENLIIRLFAPDETITKFDQITTDSEGLFNHLLTTWPESSTSFPFGTYTIEIISTEQQGISQRLDVKFTSTTELIVCPFTNIPDSKTLNIVNLINLQRLFL